MSVAIKSKSECCGCNACAEICPRRCIEMAADSAGFLYPKVNHKECIECGACERVCPLQPSNDCSYPIKCYAARRLRPEKQSGSSSGGAAAAICEKIIAEGGVAYGCMGDGARVCHTRIDNAADLPKLQGSKYAQSDARGMYAQAKQDLIAGKKVVFIGTPCQTYGLKRFLRKSGDNLLLVDIICHGVPSRQMLSEHISHIANGKEIDKVSFRDGNNFILRLYSKGKEVWSANVWEERDKDIYYKGFIEGLIYRPSCYSCKFARPERYSDITIGDFWGLKDPDLFEGNAKLGTSVILPATEKGVRFAMTLHNEMMMAERDAEEAVEGNTQLNHPVKRHKAGKIFFMLYKLLPFDTALSLAYRCGSIASRIKRKF